MSIPDKSLPMPATHDAVRVPRNKLVFRPKDDVLAEEFFQLSFKLFNTEREDALYCLNETIRFGSFSPRAFEKRAELFFLEKRFFECNRDVDFVLAASAPSNVSTSLLTLKTESLLKLGCPRMALSFLKIAKMCFEHVDFSANGELKSLRKVAKREAEKNQVGIEELNRLGSPFPDREEMLMRVKRWTPANGKKIGGAIVSSALRLRPNDVGENFVAVRDIKAGEWNGYLRLACVLPSISLFSTSRSPIIGQCP
jgi:hypothetical protein